MEFARALEYLPILLEALWLSVWITVIGFLAGCVGGLMVYLLRVAPLKPIRVLSAIYIEAFRNTPMLIHLYLIFFGLPSMGVRLDAFAATCVAMALNNSAQAAEIFRGGVAGVSKDLTEAGTALGMSTQQIFWSVVLKPAARNSIAPMTSQLIIVFLFSSIAATVAVEELTGTMRLIASDTNLVFGVFAVGGFLYFAMSFLISTGSRLFEQRLIRW